MYVPPAFREDDLAALHAAMREARLANLVTATAEGLIATPLPLFLDAAEGASRHALRPPRPRQSAVEGRPGRRGHGPVHGAGRLRHAVLVCDQAETGKVVPTWNYVAVHAYGPVEFFEDADRLLEVVTRLTEPARAAARGALGRRDAPEPFIRAQLRGIVGLRLPITRLEGKRKMSQNRSEADRAGVAAGLAASDRASDRHVATLIPA